MRQVFLLVVVCAVVRSFGVQGVSPSLADDQAHKPLSHVAVTEEDRRHWAFQLPVRPEPPGVRASERVRNSVDSFIISRLEQHSLGLLPEADVVTLVRIAYLDLWGLPPSLEAIDRFLTMNAPNKFERLIDRLLKSPHFGERWARHWLDVVGYADTVGFDTNPDNIILSEGKWRYRDYVIAAFNKDKPYDRFITEQVAGDELVDWREAKRYGPEILESLIATGFLRTARDYSHEPESDIPSNHYGVLHDTVEIVSNSLLGLTVNWARCYDHILKKTTTA